MRSLRGREWSAPRAILSSLDPIAARARTSEGTPSERPSSSDAKKPPGRYIVRERLAAGGMGTVYRVWDQVAGEERVLKRAHVEAGGRARYLREAFEREYQVLR